MLAVRRPVLLLLAFCLLLVLPGFFTLPPGDRDESRFAQATKQMLETRDFVEIRFHDVPRHKKPVGIHWAQAGAVAGVEAVRGALGLPALKNPIWPNRIPSALGIVLAVLATFALGRALVGPRAALLGAMLLGASAVAVMEAHIAKTDAAILGLTALAMGVLGRFYVDAGRSLAPGGIAAAEGARLAALFWLAIGAGLLVKGPIVPMVVLLAVIGLRLADRGTLRPLGWLRASRPIWGVPLALLVVLPWFLAVMQATEGRFLFDAINADLRPKLEGSEGLGHGAPPGYYLLTVTATLFPGAILAWCALPASWRARRDPAVRFLLAWVIPAWLLFELVPVKLPHYVSPTFPALALLAARWVLAVAEDPLLRPGKWLKRFAIAGFVLVALGVAGVAAALPWLADRRLDPLALAPVLAGLLAVALVVPAAARDAWPRAALMALATAPLLYWSVLEITLPRLEAPWIAPRVAAAIEAHWRAQPGGRPADAERLFAASGFHEPSLVFLAGTGTRLLPGQGREAAEHLAADARGLVLVRDRHEALFRAEAARLGVAPRPVARIAGFNYSRGQRLTLTLYARGE
ncbi:MAG: phospholipid carrier-dependent glycosyltransferase [Alphaproteobacteria bacterium]|nr:phospholipid carrier-dependent glycosyltransferase [Alphaproteobacteria bacterium]